MKWVVVKERESQAWFVARPTEWQTEEYYPKPWSRRSKKRRVQKGWIFPKPEYTSPFIEKHAIIEAATKEEAECLISNWT